MATKYRQAKENQYTKIAKRIGLCWAASGKLGFILKSHKFPINLEKGVSSREYGANK